jgi:hypothetical protein
MSIARFPVVASLDGAGGKKKGTVTIDRDTNLVSVRPHRSHRTYDMTLEAVANIICRSVVMQEAAEKRARKPFKKVRAA